MQGKNGLQKINGMLITYHAVIRCRQKIGIKKGHENGFIKRAILSGKETINGNNHYFDYKGARIVVCETHVKTVKVLP